MSTPPSKPQGTLIMAANSLGLPQDIPLRSLEALRSSDLVIFEEDRPARAALKAAGIHRDYLRFSEHNQQTTLTEVSSALKEGKTVTYMSDQGCPTLADPGHPILELAFQVGARVKVIPGPSSVTAALSACPFRSEKFSYLGFLPREEADREKSLVKYSDRRELLVILDTPYRLKNLLETCFKIFGGKRRGFLALDISGNDEHYAVGNFKELIAQADSFPKKLNFVLVVSSS